MLVSVILLIDPKSTVGGYDRGQSKPDSRLGWHHFVVMHVSDGTGIRVPLGGRGGNP